MTEPTPDLGAELLTQVNSLLEETRKLRAATEDVVPSVEREVRRGRWTRITVGLLAALTLGLGATAVVAIQAANRAEGIAQRVLCPVFSLLIGGYNPDTRPAGEARDTYNQQFALMNQAYVDLECRNPIVPPAIRR